jgi:hypothetical protein
MTRLQALADEFGADTHPEADWTLPLLALAIEVHREFTRPNGANGYARYGRSVVTPEEIVNQVYEVWAKSPHVTVEWFRDEVENAGAMLRTFCRYAAQNVVNKNTPGSRQNVTIVPAGMHDAGQADSGEGEDARLLFINPGHIVKDNYQWLANSTRFLSTDGDPEASFEFAELSQKFHKLLLDIVGRVANATQRAMLGLYYIEGYESDVAAEMVGIRREAGKKALQRGRASLPEDLSNALIRWRRGQFPDSGRQPLDVGDVPEVFEALLAG